MTDVGNKAETEERIFQAALAIFAEKGKAGARMQEIADRAGINKSMLHYYFRSKEKLYEEVFRYVFRRFAKLQVAQAVEQATSFHEALSHFVNGFIEATYQDNAVIRLMANENLMGGTTMGRVIASKEEKTPPSVFLKKTMEAMEKGEIRSVDPPQLLLTIISSCQFFFIWEPTIKIKFPGAKENWKGFVEERKKHIIDLFYHGLIVPDAS